MEDIEEFLNEAMIAKYDYNYNFLDTDFDGRNLYSDIVEFNEIVLCVGCIQKKKKEIYDKGEYEFDWDEMI